MNLKQLAEYLKLSQTTVSRALNGYPEVREETRKRVVEAAHRLGYRPNPYAMRLATGRAHAIGHVLPADRSLEIDPLFTEFIAGAGYVYSNSGYDMMLNVSGVEKEGDVYRRYSQTGAVDGVVILGPRMTDWRIALLTELRLPFIVHGRLSGDQHDYAWLDIDNHGAFLNAVRHLVELGHHRIGLINGNETMTFALHRRQGYERALGEKGLSIDPEIVSSLPMTEENGYRETKRFLDHRNRPTALLLSSMLQVPGSIRACYELGLRIGQDISIIAHDDGLSFLSAEGLTPKLSTVHSPIRKAGARVAELLISMITNPKFPRPQQLWPVDFILRESTGPAPPRH